MKFSETVRFHRRAQDMEQQTLAEKSECSRMTILNIENGKSSPRFKLAKRISKVLDFSLDDVE